MTDADRILGCVCEYFSISKEDLKQRRRLHRFTYPRKLAGYLMHTRTKLTTKQIARALGGDNHTMAGYYFKKTQGLIDVKDKKAIEDLSYLNTIIDSDEPLNEYINLDMCGQVVEVVCNFSENNLEIVSIRAENVVSLVLCLLGDAKGDFTDAIKKEIIKQRG
jgi:hypothetical protein